MHLSGAWTDEASANSCNPCDRVSRGHSVGFTQFTVTADGAPRMFANAVSSCGFGYPRPGLARKARPLTYPSRSLPQRELGLSPPRSHPRFGPSCELIGVPTYETARCVANRERSAAWYRRGGGSFRADPPRNTRTNIAEYEVSARAPYCCRSYYLLSAPCCSFRP
jgi:hypothetical protein